MSPLSQISLPAGHCRAQIIPSPVNSNSCCLLKFKFSIHLADLLRTFQVLCKVQAVVTQYFPYIQISLNDSEENIAALRQITGQFSCVDMVELLPFRKICQVKYEMEKCPVAFPI